MKRLAILRGALAGGVCALALATAAHAQAPRPFDLPAGDLSVTLEAYIRQSGAQLIYQPSDVRGRRSARVSGSLTPEEALDRLLAGTGLRVARVFGVSAFGTDLGLRIMEGLGLVAVT